MILIDVFVFIFGLIAGSFLNVCIHRLPREESIVRPGSHCPQCKAPVRWYDNIPLVSFIVLGGKCRDCHTRISARYFIVELLSGLIALGLWLAEGPSPRFFSGVIFLLMMLAVTLTDIETGLIPDEFSFGGMIAGLLLSALWPALQGEVLWYRALAASFFGLLMGGGILWLIGILGDWIFRKESMGGGDMKLLALIGAFLGMQKVLLVFFFAPLIGLPFAFYAKFFKKAETIAYGPFLAAAGVWFFLFGDEIVAKLFLGY